MNHQSLLFTILVIFSSTLVSPTCCTKNNGVGLFVFGDSLFDPGNHNYLNGRIKGLSNNWPYGESYFKNPTGRLCDGRLVPDFIAEFMNLPICTPYLKPGAHQFTDGANFATAGAGALVQTHPGTINLWLQLSYFKKVEKTLRQKIGATETKKFLGRAIYLFSIGGNDYFQFYSDYPNSTQFHKRQFIATVIGNFTAVLKEIHGMGGRKFGFQNAGPLGCLPSMLAKNVNSSGGCIEEALSLARLHNEELSVALEKLKTKLPGFRYSIFNYYNSMLERVNNPSKHGLKEGKSACCGSGAYGARFSCGRGTLGEDYQLCSNPNEYVWFDAAHTTQSANLQLATLLWNGSPEVTAPYNLKQFYQLSSDI